MKAKLKHLVAVSLLMLLPWLLPLSAVAQIPLASWPIAHYDDARTGFNPNEFTLGPNNVDKLAVVWTFPACGSAVDPPAIINGVAYVTADCRVGMYTYSDTLFAVNARTGALLWQSPRGVAHLNCQGSSPPAVSDGVVYAGSCYGMSAINAATGARLWQNADVGPVLGNPLYANGPAVANGMVYFTASNGIVYALYAANGLLDWSISSAYGIAGAPAVPNGVVYVATTDGVVIALVAETGAVLWTSARTPSSE